MADGYRSLLAFWAGGAANNGAAPAGVTSLLAPWIGGAGTTSTPATTPGITSLLAPWIGGAGSAGAPASVPGFTSFLAPWIGGAANDATTVAEEERRSKWLRPLREGFAAPLGVGALARVGAVAAKGEARDWIETVAYTYGIGAVAVCGGVHAVGAKHASVRVRGVGARATAGYAFAAGAAGAAVTGVTAVMHTGAVGVNGGACVVVGAGDPAHGCFSLPRASAVTNPTPEQIITILRQRRKRRT